ncbi:MAG: chemotaxis protein CheW [Spirochaetes bacterium]|nr:MAG: chemotaxis protein CheW [Spirochaetota bacterium]
MTETTLTRTNQYLTFSLENEHYAVDVAKVREVLELVPITEVPKTPGFMKGVINLRGGVVPVLDMRLKFGLHEGERTVDTCIIVMEVDVEGETIILGAVADSVQEVIEIQPEEIEPPPKIGTRLDTEFIEGMARNNDKFLIILDIDRVFTSGEITTMKEKMQGELQDSGKK